jgi:hypothetical protein
MPKDEPSAVIALSKNSLRLASLSIYELYPVTEGEEWNLPASVEAVRQRINLANKVLDERGWSKSAEENLLDEKSGAPYSRAIDGDTVQVRLRASEIKTLLSGLEAFLGRNNPSSDDKGLIDPPEKVRKVIQIFEVADKLCQDAENIKNHEVALLQ